MPIRGLILDMDGVLWRDNEQIGNLAAIFDQIHRLGLGVVFATNNASRSSRQHLEKLQSFGIRNLEPWQVVSSSDAAADYLLGKYPQGGNVYVVGEKPLAEVLEKAGFNYSETNIVAVIAGIDRTVNYYKLNLATHLIRNGAEFIGTNPDKTLPTPDGLSLGAGAILAAIEAATDVAPFIVGKPSPRMYEIALKRLALAPSEVLIVGDRLETDIVGAQVVGSRSVLVLSGVTTLFQAQNWLPAPDYILPDLTAVIEHLAHSRDLA